MANRIQLTRIPVLILFLISSGNFAHGKNRLGIFDILSKVPQYFEDPTPAPEPNNPSECIDATNSRAYSVIEQIMNTAMDALSEINNEGCDPYTPMVPMEQEYPYYQPYYPMWPMPQGPGQYPGQYPSQYPASPWGKRILGQDSATSGQSQQNRRGRRLDGTGVFKQSRSSGPKPVSNRQSGSSAYAA